MEHKKGNFPERCPHCGGDFTKVEEREVDFGIDANQEEHMYLFERRSCTECHKQFTDCYILEYDGFFTDKGEYDRNGEVIDENE